MPVCALILTIYLPIKKHKEFNIPNTTNHLDGGKFSDMKNRIRVHRGLSKSLKKKVIDYYAINNGKKL